MKAWRYRILIVLGVCLCGIVFWLANTAQPEIAFPRHLLWYRLESWWGPTVAPPTESGQLVGAIYDQGRDELDVRVLSDAMVIVANRNGQTYATMSDEHGQYRLTLPAGAYVPAVTARGFADALPQTLGFKKRVVIEASRPTTLNLTLQRAEPRIQAADKSLRFFAEAFAQAEVPQPTTVRRRGFSFVRAGQTLTESYVYEPLTTGVYPTLLFIYPCANYPCSTLNFDLLSATMAAQGFVVVTFSPQRGLHLEADIDDLSKLIAHIKSGQLSTQGNTKKLGVLAGSLTSVHLWRLAQIQHDETIQALLTLGGVSDIFLMRQRFEEGVLHLEPKAIQDLVEYALIGLGRPDTNPEWYVRYSVVYHVDALPRIPIAILHGEQDKIVPFEQTPRLVQALKNRNIPHELLTFANAQHYLQLSPPTPEELDMLDKVVGFLRRALQER